MDSRDASASKNLTYALHQASWGGGSEWRGGSDWGDGAGYNKLEPAGYTNAKLGSYASNKLASLEEGYTNMTSNMPACKSERD